MSAFSNLIGGKKVSIEDYANFAKSVSSSILESRLIRYENEIVANQEMLDKILSDENLSEENKEQAKKEAEKRENAIRTKQAKAERTNTLIQIGIDTAAAIAKVLAQTGVVSPFIIPGIVALGAAQAAFVASQPLPKFAEGTEDAPQGWAVTDEEGAEIHTDKNWKVKSLGSNKGARFNYLNKGDKIVPADISKDIMKSNLKSESDRIDMAIFRMAFNSHNDLDSKIEKGIESGFKKARITNTIINKIEAPITGFHA